MGEMVATNPVPISVTAGDDYIQLVIGHFCAGSHGQRPAVKSMHPVGVDIPRQVGRTPNAADYEEFMGSQSQSRAGPLQAIQNSEITAPWAPVRVNLSLVVPGRKLYYRLVTGNSLSSRHIAPL
jgi:hypothetical protein